MENKIRFEQEGFELEFKIKNGKIEIFAGEVEKLDYYFQTINPIEAIHLINFLQAYIANLPRP